MRSDLRFYHKLISNTGKDFPEDASEEEVVQYVQELRDDPEVNGILVQLPLPKHMDSDKVLDIIGKSVKS